jgi:hypothetical protein
MDIRINGFYGDFPRGQRVRQKKKYPINKRTMPTLGSRMRSTIIEAVATVQLVS